MKTKPEELVAETTKCQDFAIGNDIVFLPAFKDTFNALFKKKVYTEQEIMYCEKFDEPLLRYASTWSVKEAVYKAVKQISQKPISFKKIAIQRSKIAGKPTVQLPQEYSFLNIAISISHDGDYVWAVAIIKVSDHD